MGAVIFCLLFVCCLTGIICYPKSKGKINGIKSLVLGIMVILCGQALAGVLLNTLHIKAGLLGIGVFMLVAAVVLWYGIGKKKCIQKLFWRKEDVIALFLLAVFLWFVSANIFGLDLKLQYSSVRASQNFALAMHMVRGQTARTAGFATIIEALFIQICAPFTTEVMCFKGFILADMFLHLMELWMLYVTITTISQKKIVRLLAPFVCIAYFWGYPAYNYMMGNDDSFAVRSMCILLLVYALYMPAVRRRLDKETWIKRALVPAGSAVLLAVAVFVRSLDGGMDGQEIYASMYADLIFFVPVLLYVCYYALFKGKKGGAVCGLSIVMIVCTIILYVFWYQGKISNYDYYQNYAVLWLFGWLLAVLALAISAENGELPQCFSYAGFVGTLALLVISGYAGRVAGYDGSYVTKNFFSLYRYNTDCLLADYGEYRVSDSTLETYQRVMDDYNGERVPILTEDIGEQNWYDAITDNDSTAYSLTQYGLPEALERLNQNQVQAVVTQKDSEEYKEYKAYFELCQEEAATDAAIYRTSGEDWTDISETSIEGYAERMKLYNYVKAELSEEQVPLMARKESILDFILYKKATGNLSAEFYTWKYSERENIQNLNAHSIKYVVLLKNDTYYIGNQMYYDGQDIVFENEAGMVVRCIGEEWFLAE